MKMMTIIEIDDYDYDDNTMIMMIKIDYNDFDDNDCDDNMMIMMTMIDIDANDFDEQVYAAMAESLGGAWKEIHQVKIVI